MKDLTLIAWDDEVAIWLWQEAGGDRHILKVNPILQAAIYRWLTHGIPETIGSGTEQETRHTKPDHPEFMWRLGAYIMRECGLHVTFLNKPSETPEDLPTFPAVSVQEK